MRNVTVKQWALISLLGFSALSTSAAMAADPAELPAATPIVVERAVTAVALSEAHPVIPVPTSAVAGLAGMAFVTVYVLRHSARPVARHF